MSMFLVDFLKCACHLLRSITQSLSRSKKLAANAHAKRGRLQRRLGELSRELDRLVEIGSPKVSATQGSLAIG